MKTPLNTLGVKAKTKQYWNQIQLISVLAKVYEICAITATEDMAIESLSCWRFMDDLWDLHNFTYDDAINNKATMKQLAKFWNSNNYLEPLLMDTEIKTVQAILAKYTTPKTPELQIAYGF